MAEKLTMEDVQELLNYFLANPARINLAVRPDEIDKAIASVAATISEAQAKLKAKDGEIARLKSELDSMLISFYEYDEGKIDLSTLRGVCDHVSRGNAR